MLAHIRHHATPSGHPLPVARQPLPTPPPNAAFNAAATIFRSTQSADLVVEDPHAVAVDAGEAEVAAAKAGQ